MPVSDHQCLRILLMFVDFLFCLGRYEVWQKTITLVWLSDFAFCLRYSRRTCFPLRKNTATNKYSKNNRFDIFDPLMLDRNRFTTKCAHFRSQSCTYVVSLLLLPQGNHSFSRNSWFIECVQTIIFGENDFQKQRTFFTVMRVARPRVFFLSLIVS